MSNTYRPTPRTNVNRELALGVDTTEPIRSGQDLGIRRLPTWGHDYVTQPKPTRYNKRTAVHHGPSMVDKLLTAVIRLVVSALVCGLVSVLLYVIIGVAGGIQ